MYNFEDNKLAKKAAKLSHNKQRAKFASEEEYKKEMRRRALKRYANKNSTDGSSQTDTTGQMEETSSN
jgi:hypothetical protein